MHVLKNFLFFILIFLFACDSENDSADLSQDFYAKHSPRTNPGRYKKCFSDLPSSINGKVDLVKKQLIHPFDLDTYNFKTNKESRDGEFADVESLLAALDEKNPIGLSHERMPEDRLVLACYHHALFFCSMLREEGIPARMRAGYSRYFEKKYGIKFGHIICELYNKKTDEWIQIDPDREIIPAKEKDFEPASHSWMLFLEDKAKPEKYIASVSAGFKGVIHLLLLDASLVSGEEKLYYDLSPLLMRKIGYSKDLQDEELQYLQELAELLNTPNPDRERVRQAYHAVKTFQPLGLSYEDYSKYLNANR